MNTKDKRILLLTYEYPPVAGGIGRYILSMVRCLKTLGYHPIVVSAIQPQAHTIHVIHLFTGNLLLDFMRLLIFYVRFRPAKVIIAHPLAWRIFFFLSLFHRDYVVVVYGSEITSFDKARIIRNYFWKRFYWRASSIIAISKYSMSLLCSALPKLDANKIHLVYPALMDHWFENTSRRNEIRDKHGLHSIVLLTLARIVPRKGHEAVIRSLPKILSRNKDVIYLIGGTGSERSSLEELAKKLHISKNVIFTGYIPDSELPGIYDACDLFVMPTREDRGKVEGFGYTYVEAAVRGKTSIAGNHGGAAEAVVDGETGLLINPHDPDEISSKVNFLIENPEVRKSLERNAVLRARRIFHIDNMLSSLAVVFGEKDK